MSVGGGISYATSFIAEPRRGHPGGLIKGDLVDICTAMAGFTKREVQKSQPKRVFRSLKALLRGLFGPLPGPFGEEGLQPSGYL